HFPKLSFLGGRYSGFTCFHAALVYQGKREMAEIESDFAFIILQQLFYHFICLCTFFTLILSKLHQRYQCIFCTYKNIFGFNDLFDLFFICRFNSLFFITCRLVQPPAGIRLYNNNRAIWLTAPVFSFSSSGTCRAAEGNIFCCWQAKEKANFVN